MMNTCFLTFQYFYGTGSGNLNSFGASILCFRTTVSIIFGTGCSILDLLGYSSLLYLDFDFDFGLTSSYSSLC